MMTDVLEKDRNLGDVHTVPSDTRLEGNSTWPEVCNVCFLLNASSYVDETNDMGFSERGSGLEASLSKEGATDGDLCLSSNPLMTNTP